MLKFLYPSKKKLLISLIVGIVFSLIPGGSFCVDGVDFGYCGKRFGFPLPGVMPMEGTFGEILLFSLILWVPAFLGNLVIVYLIVSFFSQKKKVK